VLNHNEPGPKGPMPHGKGLKSGKYRLLPRFTAKTITYPFQTQSSQNLLYFLKYFILVINIFLVTFHAIGFNKILNVKIFVVILCCHVICVDHFVKKISPFCIHFIFLNRRDTPKNGEAIKKVMLAPRPVLCHTDNREGWGMQKIRTTETLSPVQAI
jgi:hypothetical protein